MPKPKLFVFLGLLAWFAVSVTLRCFFLAIYLEPWFFFFTLTTMSQNFLHTQHGTKLFVFLGLLAWFAVSVTLRCFFGNLLGTMVFLFHADNNVSEFFTHTTRNEAVSRLVGLVCCECHIAMFFFGNLLGTMVFLFHADNNVSEFFTHTTRNEAVRISRLVGLVCCECHIATFFLPIYLEPWFFFFTLTTMFQNFLDTQHRTAPRGLFRFCCERCGSQVFALCTIWSAVAGQSALVAGGCLLFDARTWLGSGRPGRTDQTVSLFQCPFCSCVLGIVFSCFFGPSLFGASLQEWEHIKWRQHGGLRYWNLCLECHRHVLGTDGRTSNRYCRPRCLPCPRLPAGELFVREPLPELAPCSHFCFPCSTMGSPTGNFF